MLPWNYIFTEIHDGGRRHLEFRKLVAISLILDRSLPNLVGILKLRHITQLLLQKCIFTKIQDGGHRLLEFWRSVAISILLNQSSPNLVGMLKIWQRTQMVHQNCIITKVQDGGGHHLEFRKSVAIPLLLDRFLPKLVGMLKLRHITQQYSIRPAYLLKFKTAAAAFLNFENRLPFQYYWTNRHQIWWECWESDIELICCIKIA